MTSGKRRGIFVGPRNILEDTRLKANWLAALVRLASHSPNWIVKRAVERKALGISDDTYGKILNDLESWGYIARKRAHRFGKVTGLHIKVTWPDAVDLSPKKEGLERGDDLDWIDVIDYKDEVAKARASRPNSPKLNPKVGGLENRPNPPQAGSRNEGSIKDHNMKDHKGALEMSNVAHIRPVVHCLEDPAPPFDNALYHQSQQEAAQWEPCAPYLGDDPDACPVDEWLGHLSNVEGMR